MNFANTHMANAHRFARLAYDLETANAKQPFGPFIEDIMANVTASVMFSAASLEAYLNEVQFAPNVHFPDQAPELVKSSLALLKGQSLLERVAFLAVLNGRPKPDWGQVPGQNVAALVQLRKPHLPPPRRGAAQ